MSVTKHFCTKRLSNTGTGFLQKWSVPQVCHCLRRNGTVFKDNTLDNML